MKADNLLPHYLAKYQSLTVQLCSKVSDTYSFIGSKYPHRRHVFEHMSMQI